MILKTILFFLLLYLIIKIVSNLFLSDTNRKKSNVRFFYHTYKNVRDQQEKQQKKRQQNKKPNERLDEIEEAEYEDVTDNNTDSEKK